jgi:hypothetical protein
MNLVAMLQYFNFEKLFSVQASDDILGKLQLELTESNVSPFCILLSA